MPLELIGFEGAVSCAPHGASLRLRGIARGGAGAAEVDFNGVAWDSARGASAMLPPQLRRVSVIELAPGAAPRRSFRIDSSAGSVELLAGTVQVHRDAARAFFGALPPPRVPRATRLGWSVLLGLLRVPGAARVLARWRG